MKPGLSIVIPTYNEEKFLPNLLRCLKASDFQRFEVIVADNKSKDKTIAIAKKFGARICSGGLPGTGRNKGIRFAKAERVLFLDADATFPPDFISKCLAEIQRRELDAAGVYLNPVSKNPFDRFSFLCYNFYMWVTERIYPRAVGCCIFTTKTLHAKLHGFDERIRLNEDADYARRAAKKGTYGLLHRKVNYSLRRFSKEGRIRLLCKYLHSEWFRIVHGEARHNEIPYEFTGYR